MKYSITLFVVSIIFVLVCAVLFKLICWLGVNDSTSAFISVCVSYILVLAVGEISRK